MSTDELRKALVAGGKKAVQLAEERNNEISKYATPEYQAAAMTASFNNLDLAKVLFAISDALPPL